MNQFAAYAGMSAVLRNLAKSPESDRQAIAVYPKSLPRSGCPRRSRKTIQN
jgi:hypothetical protein